MVVLSTIDEIRARLAKHYERLDRITVTIGAQDGGSRTYFQFYDSAGRILTEWEDWSLALDEIERELRRSWYDVHRSGFGSSHTFSVRKRHQIPAAPAVQP